MSTFNDRDSLMIESGIDPDSYVSSSDDNSDFSEKDFILDLFMRRSCTSCKFLIDDCCHHLDVPDFYVPAYIQYSGCGLYILEDLK